jgi:hypothetical protein
MRGADYLLVIDRDVAEGTAMQEDPFPVSVDHHLRDEAELVKHLLHAPHCLGTWKARQRPRPFDELAAPCHAGGLSLSGRIGDASLDDGGEQFGEKTISAPIGAGIVSGRSIDDARPAANQPLLARAPGQSCPDQGLEVTASGGHVEADLGGGSGGVEPIGARPQQLEQSEAVDLGQGLMGPGHLVGAGGVSHVRILAYNHPQ